MVGDVAKVSRTETEFGCAGLSAAVSMSPPEFEEIGSDVNQGAIYAPNEYGVNAIGQNLELIEKSSRSIAAVQEQENSVFLASMNAIGAVETGEGRLEGQCHRLKLSSDNEDETSAFVAYCPGLLVSERVPVLVAQKSQCCEFNIL